MAFDGSGSSTAFPFPLLPSVCPQNILSVSSSIYSHINLKTYTLKRVTLENSYHPAPPLFLESLWLLWSSQSLCFRDLYTFSEMEIGNDDCISRPECQRAGRTKSLLGSGGWRPRRPDLDKSLNLEKFSKRNYSWFSLSSWRSEFSCLSLLSFQKIFIGPRCPWGPIYGSGSLSLTHLCADLTDVTLADEDTKSIGQCQCQCQ